jgi:cyclopropane-fatty-acyl-phospholipid synthase
MAVVERRAARAGVTDPAALVHGVHGRIEQATGVSLAMRLWDGTQLGDAAASYRIVLNRPDSLRAALLPPTDLAAGEAYVTGAIDIEGDTVAALHDGQRVMSGLDAASKAALARQLLKLPHPPKLAVRPRAQLRGRRHSRERDRDAVAFHYDHPEAFYESFLDRNLVYSCAYFSSPDDPLEAAQEAKLDLICRKLRLQAGQRFLDIGCGWGSLLIHAGRHYDVDGLGVTLSRTQYEAGRRRVSEAGLDGRVEIRLADYRDLEGTFDAVASVGMVEHVGAESLPGYFDTAYRLTAPGGLFCNHGIVTGEAERVRRSRSRDFIGTYVFPDGSLVPAWRMVRELQRSGFELLDVEQLRRHYALTLRRWVANLERNARAAVRASGEATYRVWRLYMAGSAQRFESRGLGVTQVVGVKPGDRAAPLPLARAQHLERA